MATCLVVNKSFFYAENGEFVPEVWFKKDTERQFINIEETHHGLSITDDKGGSRAVSYHNPNVPERCNKSYQMSNACGRSIRKKCTTRSIDTI